MAWLYEGEGMRSVCRVHVAVSGHLGLHRAEPGCERAVPPAGSRSVPVRTSDPGRRAVAHMWVESKAPWFDITDALPQFDTGDPATQRPQHDKVS